MNIRKNIYTLTDAQLADFKDAVNAIKTNGKYDTFIEHHHHAMMQATLSAGEAGDELTRNVAHRGPAFLPWHRYFCREFELALQSVKPTVTLPYWDWAAEEANPLGAPLWNTNPVQRIYIGGDGTGPNGTVVTGPFTGWTALVETSGGALVPRAFTGIVRDLGGATFGNPDFPTVAQVDDAVNNYPSYDTSPWHRSSAGSFRNKLEGWLSIPPEDNSQLHNRIHIWVGGDMGPGTSPNDPVFYLNHCNVDRLWARWQHAHPASTYLPASGGPPGHNFNDTMAHLATPGATPAGSIDYRRTMGFIYDTDPPLVDLPNATLNFDDVPTLETTWRAAAFHVRAGSTIHLSVVSGSGPNAPYSLTPLGGSVTHTPPVDNQPYDVVRVWFAFTGAAAPGVAPNGSVQIHCQETNETFTLTLKGNTIARPTTGVVFVLDKSGSMAAQAGTGMTRMQLLHEAAARCIELIRDDSGAGMVSFNENAQPGQALLPFTSMSTHRTDVLNAVTALSPGGNTSIGDGVVLGRTVLNTGAAAFDTQALIVLTDGLENEPQFLSSVTGSIDSRTFAIGLGTAYQVSAEALARIAHQTDGYLLLTGPLTTNTDSYFLLSKYFQQILVNATAEDIVTDPSGYVGPGDEVRIPVELAETDIDATFVLLVDVPAVDLAIETPAGDLLTESDLINLGAQVTHGTNMTYCRLALPTPVGGGAHTGTWWVVLSGDKGRFEKELREMERESDRETDRRVLTDRDRGRLAAHGVRYSLSVSAWSNVRMAAGLSQSTFEPGTVFRLHAGLDEFGQPVAGRAVVEATLRRPDGKEVSMALAEAGPGSFAAELVGDQEGVWLGRIRAEGNTLRGSRFAREQAISGLVMRPGGERPGGGERSDIERLLRCLAGDEQLREWIRERGLDPERLARCLGDDDDAKERRERG
jgi:Mg-chelatase subunit ChlD